MHKEMSNKEIINFSLNYIYKIVMLNFCRIKKKNRTKTWSKNSTLV